MAYFAERRRERISRGRKCESRVFQEGPSCIIPIYEGSIASPIFRLQLRLGEFTREEFLLIKYCDIKFEHL